MHSAQSIILNCYWVLVETRLNVCGTRHVTRFSIRRKSTMQIKTGIHLTGKTLTAGNLLKKDNSSWFLSMHFYYLCAYIWYICEMYIMHVSISSFFISRSFYRDVNTDESCLKEFNFCRGLFYDFAVDANCEMEIIATVFIFYHCYYHYHWEW